MEHLYGVFSGATFGGLFLCPLFHQIPGRPSPEHRASIPDAEAPADITSDHVEKLIDQKLKGADSLGEDPVTGKKVHIFEVE